LGCTERERERVAALNAGKTVCGESGARRETGKRAKRQARRKDDGHGFFPHGTERMGENSGARDKMGKRKEEKW
jgi:hypothetical protein